MSPERGSSPKPEKPKPVKPKPVKPWQRVEPGRYRSSDERFTLVSDGGGRWFVTDDAERDELGLARTTGPFGSLEAARTAADAARGRPAAASPLAPRLADAASRPRRAIAGQTGATLSTPGPELVPGPMTESAPQHAPEPAPAPPPRTWLDDLADRDPEAVRRAQGLIAALEREGITNADALVRRDTLGDTPAIAARLLARDLVTAVAGLQDPRPVDIVEAVAAVLAGSPSRDGLPGWELVERNGPGGRTRRLRLVPDDLR